MSCCTVSQNDQEPANPQITTRQSNPLRPTAHLAEQTRTATSTSASLLLRVRRRLNTSKPVIWGP